jgi:catechol 2,3-dioxygenase
MIRFRLPDDTRIGSVTLRISDRARALAFYEGTLGLREGKREGPLSFLSPGGDPPFAARLEVHPAAVRKPDGTTGLYHVAFRLPDRKGLARAVARLLAARYPLQGFADHRVSEAVYLADPDGNGLELYADRPRQAWQAKGGRVRMATDPLDVVNLLSEADKGHASGAIAPGTEVGHVHLCVSDLRRAERFYAEVLGLAVTQRDLPGALFFSAGGYHHHIGANLWAGANAPAPPPKAVGLSSFALLVPEEKTVHALRERLLSAGMAAKPVPGDPEAVATCDPDGVELEILPVQRAAAMPRSTSRISEGSMRTV